ncbi:MAG: hypothetical protein ABI234_19430 [Ktedonobacteraceae bacterium]
MENEMAMQLTDDEYAALTKREITRQELEALIHEMIEKILARRLQLVNRPNRLLSKQEIGEYLYREGVIEHIPTGRVNFEEVEAERNRLADLLGQAEGKSASKMVIEDRGPY